MKKAEYSKLISSDAFAWCAVTEKGEVLTDSFVQVAQKSKRCESIKVTLKEFSANNLSIKRIEVFAGDATFVVDKILSQEAIDVKTKFQIKYTRDLRSNVAEKNKLVIRGNGIGAKFFRLLYQADGEDILKSAGLVLPDGFYDNSQMNLTYYTGMHKFAKEHTVLYGICTDTENRIAAWHFFDENGFVARPPSQTGGYRIILSKENLFVENLDALQDNVKVDI